MGAAGAVLNNYVYENHIHDDSTPSMQHFIGQSHYTVNKNANRYYHLSPETHWITQQPVTYTGIKHAQKINLVGHPIMCSHPANIKVKTLV